MKFACKCLSFFLTLIVASPMSSGLAAPVSSGALSPKSITERSEEVVFHLLAKSVRKYGQRDATRKSSLPGHVVDVFRRAGMPARVQFFGQRRNGSSLYVATVASYRFLIEGKEGQWDVLPFDQWKKFARGYPMLENVFGQTSAAGQAYQEPIPKPWPAELQNVVQDFRTKNAALFQGNRLVYYEGRPMRITQWATGETNLLTGVDEATGEKITIPLHDLNNLTKLSLMPP